MSEAVISLAEKIRKLMPIYNEHYTPQDTNRVLRVIKRNGNWEDFVSCRKAILDTVQLNSMEEFRKISVNCKPHEDSLLKTKLRNQVMDYIKYISEKKDLTKRDLSAIIEYSKLAIADPMSKLQASYITTLSRPNIVKNITYDDLEWLILIFVHKPSKRHIFTNMGKIFVLLVCLQAYIEFYDLQGSGACFKLNGFLEDIVFDNEEILKKYRISLDKDGFYKEHEEWFGKHLETSEYFTQEINYRTLHINGHKIKCNFETREKKFLDIVIKMIRKNTYRLKDIKDINGAMFIVRSVEERQLVSEYITETFVNIGATIKKEELQAFEEEFHIFKYILSWNDYEYEIMFLDLTSFFHYSHGMKGHRDVYRKQRLADYYKLIFANVDIDWSNYAN